MFSVSSYKWLRCWSLLIETWAIRKELSYWEFKMLTGNSRFFIYFFFFRFWMNIWENIAFEAAPRMNHSQRHPSGWKLPASKWCTDSAPRGEPKERHKPIFPEVVRDANQVCAEMRLWSRPPPEGLPTIPCGVCFYGPERPRAAWPVKLWGEQRFCLFIAILQPEILSGSTVNYINIYIYIYNV